MLHSVKRLLQKWAVETMKTEQIRSRRGYKPMARSQNDGSRILPGVKVCEVAEMGEGEERLMMEVTSCCLFTLRPMTSVLSW